MSLLVVEPGLQSLVVDGGRASSRSLGVPVGGAADRFSWMLGNALIGNAPDAAALEICLAGPALTAQSDVGLAVVGAPFDLAIDDKPAAANRAFTVRRGQTLRIAGAKRMARAYLCVRGGFDESVVLGSRSAFETIRAGQILNCAESTAPERGITWPPTPPADGPMRLRAVLGPQAEWFPLDAFFGPAFDVTSASDRMGIRMLGEPLPRPERELVSEPVAPGAVQVVNDGQCIVLGVDGQTIGGYPKIANVVAADLDGLGQLRQGERVVFELATQDEAAAAWRERQLHLSSWITRLHV